MKCKEKLKEEVDFWLGYISEWETNHDEPVPERAQLLLDNALLKLERYCSDKRQTQHTQINKHTIH